MKRRKGWAFERMCDTRMCNSHPQSPSLTPAPPGYPFHETGWEYRSVIAIDDL